MHHGWGSHPGKSGHGLTNILTLYTSLIGVSTFRTAKAEQQVPAGLTNKMLVPPALCMSEEDSVSEDENHSRYIIRHSPSWRSSGNNCL